MHIFSLSLALRRTIYAFKGLSQIGKQVYTACGVVGQIGFSDVKQKQQITKVSPFRFLTAPMHNLFTVSRFTVTFMY